MSSVLKPVLGSQLQFGHPLAQGIVGCWLFNEGAGNKVFDLSGNGNAGTVTGADWGPEGIRMDADDEYISVSSIPFGPEGTAIMYYDSAATYGAFYNFFEYNGGGGFEFCRWTGDTFRYRMGDSLIQLSVAGVRNAEQLVLTWSESQSYRKVWLDGQYKNQNTTAFTWSAPTTWYVGGIETDRNLGAIIKSVMVYNRALTSSEIALLYREPFCMFQRMPIDLWIAAISGGAPTVKPMWYYQEMMRRAG